MNNLLQNLFASLKRGRMDQADKFAVRMKLQSLMRDMPVRKGFFARHVFRGSRIPLLSFTFSKPMMIALIVAVAMALSGGVSYAAEQSLPGDALYVIKTSVNEPIREALAVSAEAKAEVQANHVERRLQEAEALAVEGRLSEDVRLAIEQHLNDQIERVKERIEKFKGMDNLGAAAEMSARLEVTLRAHDQILETMTLTINGETKEFHEKVKKEHEESEDLDEETQKSEEEDDDDKDEEHKKEAAEGKREAAKHKWEEVAKFVAKSKVSAQTKTEAESRLKAVEDMISKGNGLMEAKDYEQAFEAFRDAHRAAQEVKVYVSAERATMVRVELHDDEDEDKKDEEERDSEEREERRDQDDDEDDEDQDEDDRDDDEDDDRDSLELRIKTDIEVEEDD